MYNFLELFSGNADITKEIKKHSNCISIDYNQEFNPDICKDVYTLEQGFFKCFDAIWLSPDCTTYSLAARNTHRIKGGVPISEYAKYCDENNNHLIQTLKAVDRPFIIENPRGHLRNMDFMKGLYRITIYYSTYGEIYQKPTDLFSNRPIEHLFNTKKTPGTIHMDYVRQYKDFLGRCKIPGDLIENIEYALKELAKNEY